MVMVVGWKVGDWWILLWINIPTGPGQYFTYTLHSLTEFENYIYFCQCGCYNDDDK